MPRIELHGEHIADQSPRHFTKMNNADHQPAQFPEGRRYCTIAQSNVTFIESIAWVTSWENSPKQNENLVYEKPPEHYSRDAGHNFFRPRELAHEGFLKIGATAWR
jgi:hypothetical protein